MLDTLISALKVWEDSETHQNTVILASSKLFLRFELCKFDLPLLDRQRAAG